MVSSCPDRPLELLDLPAEVVFKILRDYVPASDKVRTLQWLSAFRPYFLSRTIYYPCTRRLMELSQFCRPGWYVNRRLLHSRWHVAVDYDQSTLTVHEFDTSFTHTTHCRCIYKSCPSLIRMKVELTQNIPWQHLERVNEQDVLFYKTRSSCFWIFTRDQTVHGSGGSVSTVHNNQFYLPSDHLLLRVLPDWQCLSFQNDISRYQLLPPIPFAVCEDAGGTEMIGAYPVTPVHCVAHPTHLIVHACNRTIYNLKDLTVTIKFFKRMFPWMPLHQSNGVC